MDLGDHLTGLPATHMATREAIAVYHQCIAGELPEYIAAIFAQQTHLVLICENSVLAGVVKWPTLPPPSASSSES